MARSIGEILKELETKMAERAMNTETPISGTSIYPNSTDYDCPECQDRGLVFIDNDTVRRCSCVERKRRRRLLARSGFTDDYLAMTFKRFQWKDRPDDIQRMFKAAVHYRQHFQAIRNDRANSCLFMGSPGSGKTHLLAAVSGELMREEGVEVLYFPYIDGMKDLKRDLDAAPQKLDALVECDVLFLDDLYKNSRGEPTKYETDAIYYIVNSRYMQHRPILVSTEYGTNELLGVDEAIGSRLIEMAGEHSIHLKGSPAEMNWRISKGRKGGPAYG